MFCLVKSEIPAFDLSSSLKRNKNQIGMESPNFNQNNRVICFVDFSTSAQKETVVTKSIPSPIEFCKIRGDTLLQNHCTKMKFSIKDFFSKCDQIHSLLQIWSHLLKKSLMENFIFCAVNHFERLNESRCTSSEKEFFPMIQKSQKSLQYLNLVRRLR